MSWREWKKKKSKIKNLTDSRSSRMVQISESATNGNRREMVTVRGLLATVHRQRFKASPVRTRRSVVVDLETVQSVAVAVDWEQGEASTASFDSDAETLQRRRFEALTATVRRRRFDGDASKLRRRRFDSSTATLRSFDGDAETLRRRAWMGFSFSIWVSFFFCLGFWVNVFFFWLSGWMYGAFCLGLYIVEFSDENISSLKATSSEEFMFCHKRSRISYTFSDEFYFRH